MTNPPVSGYMTPNLQIPPLIEINVFEKNALD